MACPAFMELAMPGEAHVLWVVKGIQADPYEIEANLISFTKKE